MWAMALAEPISENHQTNLSMNDTPTFTHLSDGDQPRMVDISEKTATKRIAVAEARVALGPALAKHLRETGSTKKGPVFQKASSPSQPAARSRLWAFLPCRPVASSVISCQPAKKLATASAPESRRGEARGERGDRQE